MTNATCCNYFATCIFASCHWNTNKKELSILFKSNSLARFIHKANFNEEEVAQASLQSLNLFTVSKTCSATARKINKESSPLVAACCRKGFRKETQSHWEDFMGSRISLVRLEEKRRKGRKQQSKSDKIWEGNKYWMKSLWNENHRYHLIRTLVCEANLHYLIGFWRSSISAREPFPPKFVMKIRRHVY